MIAGTTDTPVEQPALEPRALKAECDFILDELRPYLQVPPLSADVLSIYAGLRPLVQSGKEQRTADLSRDHVIRTNALGLITIMGGKWTTYRKMGEDLLDYVERARGWTHRLSRSRYLPIHGAGAARDSHAAASAIWNRCCGDDAIRFAAIRGMQPIHPGFDYFASGGYLAGA